MKRAILVLAVLALPLEASALEQGARVRVTVLAREAQQVEGRFLGLQSDSLVVVAEPDSLTRYIARLDVRKLEVSRGMKSNAGRGALIGGSILGVACGLIVWNGVSSLETVDEDSVLAALGAGALGALAGAGVGALIGSASHHEDWDDVQVKRKEPAK